MKKQITLWTIMSIWCALCSSISWAQMREVKLKIVQTSDIHGNYDAYDWIQRRPVAGGLARVSTYVRQERITYGNRLILIDNGDILQGQPGVYYYNFIDTTSTHLTAAIMNYMRYDVGNMGNHDVETGRKVFERWVHDCHFPVLSANMLNADTRKPHFKPYHILEREGVKIAVLGMITPAIPVWLPQTLWQGLCFEDMEQTARYWVKVIRETEHPDVLIGVFHAGREALTLGGKYRDNASVEVAQRIPGFDIVLTGHDHARDSRKITNVAGDTVWIMDPGSGGAVVSEVALTLKLEHNKVINKQIEGKLIAMNHVMPDTSLLNHFAPQYQAIKQFVSKKIGTLTQTLSTRPAYFGPSPFMDLIHDLQLRISGADISFAAPLSFDTQIAAGDIYVSDLFGLYKYENMLYTMQLSGKEILRFLEMSYGQWFNQMHCANDDLLLLRPHTPGSRTSFQNFSYNFDSAAGIVYTVDVTRPVGSRITIVSMADGTPFCEDKTYKVALNSYRGNGGGELLTQGAGIPHNQLPSRILHATDKDLRYYLMQYMEQMQYIDPKPVSHWKIIPEAWTQLAAQRDSIALFGRNAK